jgi:hypothetical protein
MYRVRTIYRNKETVYAVEKRVLGFLWINLIPYFSPFKFRTFIEAENYLLEEIKEERLKYTKLYAIEKDGLRLLLVDIKKLGVKNV